MLCTVFVLVVVTTAVSVGSSLRQRFRNESLAKPGIDRSLPLVLSRNLVNIDDDRQLDDFVERRVPQLFDYGHRLVGKTSKDLRTVEMAKRLQKYQEHIPVDAPFPCRLKGTRSKTPPSSVHRLRPGDIDVVAAVGDSLTAGTGIAAATLAQVPTTNRGLSWSIGGYKTWREILTLPNILKEFNPSLLGYATEDVFFTERSKEQHYNLAEPAAVTGDTLHMVSKIISKMKADSRVDFEKHWKLVTIMVGGIDLCFDICYLTDPWQAPRQQRDSLAAALDYLQQHSPRTLVNLVLVPDISHVLAELNGLPLLNQILYPLFCPCFKASAFKSVRKELSTLVNLIQQAQLSVADDTKYQEQKDFAVVAQPFLLNARFLKDHTTNKTDLRYLAPDYFHFSQRGHALASNALWNNMLEPVGSKATTWTEPFTLFRCPTRLHPYIYTQHNSNIY